MPWSGPSEQAQAKRDAVYDALLGISPCAELADVYSTRRIQ